MIHKEERMCKRVLKHYVVKYMISVVVLMTGISAAGLVELNKGLVTGVWHFESPGATETGPCPQGIDSSGTLEIKKEANGFSLHFTSGQVCKPAFTCQFLGDIQKDHLILSNHGVVDDEGGKVTNTLDITMTQKKSMTAESRSEYAHPSGIKCIWKGTMKLSR